MNTQHPTARTLTEMSDQRKTQRVPQEATVRYSVGGQGDYHPARMFNYNSTGMYLEISFTPPKLGASLLIEVLDGDEGDPWLEADAARTCYYAKVIWKKNLPDSNAGYGVGLRYLSMASPEF